MKRRLIELWYSQHEDQAEGTRVAPGAKLHGDRVLSGVSVNPEDVQAVAVSFGALALTLKGGATVGVPVENLSPYAAKRLAHLRKAAVEIRAQVVQSPEGLLKLVRVVRDLCAEAGDRYGAGPMTWSSVGCVTDEVRKLEPDELLARARERLSDAGHEGDPIRNPSDHRDRVALVRKVLETVAASLPNEALPPAAIRACLDHVDPEGLLAGFDAESDPTRNPEPTEDT